MTANLLEATRWFVVMTAELVVLFLALSFLIGLLQAWIPEEKVHLVFEKRSPVGAYGGGAVLGALTPFCTCSSIPVLAALLRSGAPFGPTMTFLFASPLLDPVVLGLLAFVIGLKGAALYAVVTFVASIGMGVLMARLGLETDVKEAAYRSKGEDGSCSVGPPQFHHLCVEVYGAPWGSTAVGDFQKPLREYGPWRPMEVNRGFRDKSENHGVPGSNPGPAT